MYTSIVAFLPTFLVLIESKICSKCDNEEPQISHHYKTTCAETCEFLNDNDVLPYFIMVSNNICQGDYFGCKSFDSLIQPLGLKNMVISEGQCSCNLSLNEDHNLINFPSTCRKACRRLKKTLTPGVKVVDLQCSSSYKIECQVYDKFVRPWGFSEMKLEHGKCTC